MWMKVELMELLSGGDELHCSLFFAPRQRVPKQKPDNSDDERGTDSQEEADSDQEDAEEPKESEQPADDGDDDEWSALQEETRKENMLDAKSKETHIVHCPYFPGVSTCTW